jgi:hypothetical protein
MRIVQAILLVAGVTAVVAAKKQFETSDYVADVWNLELESAPQDLFKESYEFLMKYMPEHDKDLPDMFIASNIGLALKARFATSWAREVPWDIFLNNVLPYAVLDENRDFWRPLLFTHHYPLVKDAKSVEEAALILSRGIWKYWNVTFVSDQTPTTMSPFQTLRAHNASCTGLSILLVDACRSVGIPARITGTPEWNNGVGGNHDWVEIWFNGAWSFMDSFDGSNFNQTWFFPNPAKDQVPNSGNHSIYASSWATTSGNVKFPLAWAFDDHSVNGEDVTQYYLDLN